MAFPSSTRGILVAFEGIDGAGKTTQLRRLEQLLTLAGLPFASTKEPTQGVWGQKIRASAVHGRMELKEELDTFLLDRQEHVSQLIEPSLAANKIVLVDRYYFSTVAYQGARGIDPAYLLQVNEFAPEPDVLVILDVEPTVGLRRIRERGDSADLFEKEDELGRARTIFQSLRVPNLHLIDGLRPVVDISYAIAKLVIEGWISTHPSDRLTPTLNIETLVASVSGT